MYPTTYLLYVCYQCGCLNWWSHLGVLLHWLFEVILVDSHLKSIAVWKTFYIANVDKTYSSTMWSSEEIIYNLQWTIPWILAWYFCSLQTSCCTIEDCQCKIHHTLDHLETQSSHLALHRVGIHCLSPVLWGPHLSSQALLSWLWAQFVVHFGLSGIHWWLSAVSGKALLRCIEQPPDLSSRSSVTPGQKKMLMLVVSLYRSFTEWWVTLSFI